MGGVIEVIGGQVTSAAATIETVVAAVGDSFTLRAFSDSDGAELVGFWGQEATPGFIRVRSARLHDNVQGIRFQNPSASPRDLMGDYEQQKVFSTDTLIWELQGGAAEVDVITYMLYYNNLPGASQNVLNWSDVQPRIESYMGCEVDPVSSATAGTWGPGRAINADNDNFKANRSYALLGYETSAAVCTVAVRGADTANYRIGGPGPTEPLETRDWFIRQAIMLGKPCIPIIQANNRQTTLLDVITNATSATPKVTLHLALLTP